MYLFFEMLMFLAIIAGIVGMVKPRVFVFWTHKKTRGKAAFYFVPAFIFMILMGLTYPHLSSTNKIAKSDSSSQVSLSSSSSPAAPSSSQAVSSSVPAAPSSSHSIVKPSSSSAKPLSPPSVITGSNAADLKLSLEQWGLKDYKCTARTDGFEGYFYKCETSDPDTGAELTYFISTNQTFAIEGTTFSVSNMDMADSDSFLSVCQGYLGYCATMPYDAAQQAKAKSWVEENMASANTKGHVLSIVIGDAKFELFGISNTSRTLEISKAK